MTQRTVSENLKFLLSNTIRYYRTKDSTLKCEEESDIEKNIISEIRKYIIYSINLHILHWEEAAWVQNLCLELRNLMVSEAEAETAELTGSSGSLPRSAASLLRYCLSCLSGEARNAQSQW